MSDIGIGLVANMVISERALSSNDKNYNFNDEMIKKRLQGIQCGILDNFAGFSNIEANKKRIK